MRLYLLAKRFREYIPIASLSDRLVTSLEPEIQIMHERYTRYKASCVEKGKETRISKSFGDYLSKGTRRTRVKAIFVFEIEAETYGSPRILSGEELIGIAQDLGYNTEE